MDRTSRKEFEQEAADLLPKILAAFELSADHPARDKVVQLIADELENQYTFGVDQGVAESW